MTLELLKEAFESVSLAHVEIESFIAGDRFDHAKNTDTKYPLTFLELPYTVNYSDDGRQKEYQFAFYVLFKGKEDTLNHSLISKAEDIGDMILSKVKHDAKYNSDITKQFTISGVNGLSLNAFSDDTASGMRYEMTVTSMRQYDLESCYSEFFNAPCTDC